MASVGQSYAVLRGRMTGNREKAAGVLDSMSVVKLREVNRQESLARNRKLRGKPYRLGERLRVRR